MKRRQAFRFALRPDPDQERLFRQCAGACRFVYNRALALEIERHAAGEKRLGYVGTANLLPLWKQDPETVWLAFLPSQILQQALKDLDRAWRNFFEKRAGFPNFRKKGQNDAFRFPQGVKLDQEGARIFLPKVGWVRYR
ncbi:MAG: RNA-guided endonuclease InsQ/TnpB family protein, partial [Leptospirillia bacterium]